MATVVSPDADPVLQVQGLRKRYGAVQALGGVSLSLPLGQWWVMLGPNGAGKSTLVQLLCGLFVPDEGRIAIAGHDLTAHPSAALAHLGVVFQQSTLDVDLTVQQNLDHHAALHGLVRADALARTEALLGWMGLQDQARRTVRELSGGNRRKVELVRALLHGPRVLLMDEATVGLDPASREHLLASVAELVRQRQLSVLWTTHWVQEARHADALLILNRGQLVFQAPPAQLLAHTGQTDWETAFLQVIQNDKSGSERS
jgi:ABC-2 type transport system ATP-binding protein